MRFTSAVAALVLLCAEASSAHRSVRRRHTHTQFAKLAKIHAEVEHADVEKRKSTCTLPDHSDLHFVPGDVNNGFAMSPDQACEDGMYCPIACKPGKVMAQWEADTTYESESMNGGLYCDGGKAKKPFEDKPYCVDGTGTVQVVNKIGKKCSFCQTVLPGNEAMLIPTVVDDSTTTLAVPDPDYWDSTSAHYYINPPGTGDEGCIWGDESKPIGNWAPYVAGANTDKDGQTFLKLGFNPIYEHEGDGLDKSALNFGVRIDCPDGGCNGLPCELNPSKKKYGEVVSNQGSVGAGDSAFCVVTVPSGSKGNIVVFSLDGSEGGSEDDDDDSYEEEEPTSTTSSSSSSASETTDDETSGSSSGGSSPTVGPGLFREGGGDSDGSGSSATSSSGSSGTDDNEDAEEEESEENDAPGRQSSAAVAGLVIALAAACLY